MDLQKLIARMDQIEAKGVTEKIIGQPKIDNMDNAGRGSYSGAEQTATTKHRLGSHVYEVTTEQDGDGDLYYFIYVNGKQMFYATSSGVYEDKLGSRISSVLLDEHKKATAHLFDSDEDEDEDDFREGVAEESHSVKYKNYTVSDIDESSMFKSGIARSLIQEFGYKLDERAGDEPMSDADYAKQMAQGQKNLNSIKGFFGGKPAAPAELKDAPPGTPTDPFVRQRMGYKPATPAEIATSQQANPGGLVDGSGKPVTNSSGQQWGTGTGGGRDTGGSIPAKMRGGSNVSLGNVPSWDQLGTRPEDFAKTMGMAPEANPEAAMGAGSGAAPVAANKLATAGQTATPEPAAATTAAIARVKQLANPNSAAADAERDGVLAAPTPAASRPVALGKATPNADGSPQTIAVSNSQPQAAAAPGQAASPAAPAYNARKDSQQFQDKAEADSKVLKDMLTKAANDAEGLKGTSDVARMKQIVDGIKQMQADPNFVTMAPQLQNTINDAVKKADAAMAELNKASAAAAQGAGGTPASPAAQANWAYVPGDGTVAGSAKMAADAAKAAAPAVSTKGAEASAKFKAEKLARLKEITAKLQAANSASKKESRLSEAEKYAALRDRLLMIETRVDEGLWDAAVKYGGKAVDGVKGAYQAAKTGFSGAPVATGKLTKAGAPQMTSQSSKQFAKQLATLPATQRAAYNTAKVVKDNPKKAIAAGAAGAAGAAYALSGKPEQTPPEAVPTVQTGTPIPGTAPGEDIKALTIEVDAIAKELEGDDGSSFQNDPEIQKAIADARAAAGGSVGSSTGSVTTPPASNPLADDPISKAARPKTESVDDELTRWLKIAHG